MDQHVDWERLGRYVTDQCSPDEAAEVERWIALDPTRRKAVRDMQAIWANAQVAPTGWDVAKAWQELSPRLDQVGVGEPIPTRVTRPWFTPAWGLRIAAALAVLVGGGLLYRSF